MVPSKPMIDQASAQAKTEQWVRALKILSVLVVASAALLAGYAMWMKGQESKSLKAFSALAQADAIEARVLRGAKVLSQDPVEALREASENERSAYLAALEKVRSEHPRTTAAHLAALRLGRWAAETSDWAKAESYYRDLLGELRGRQNLIYASMASEALGVVYENQGRWEDALKVFDSALASDESTLKPLLMLGKARVLSSLKKTEEAKAVYDSIVQNFPNSPYSQQARALAVKVSL